MAVCRVKDSLVKNTGCDFVNIFFLQTQILSTSNYLVSGMQIWEMQRNSEGVL